MPPNSPFLNKRYDEIFNELYAPLCRYCMRFVDMETAEDLVQNQLANLWENWSRLSKIESIEGYLYTSVKNRALNYIRKESRKSNDSDLNEFTEKHSDHNADPHSILENSELRQILEDSLDNLPKKCKEIFILKRFGELSNKEISAKLGISIKTVESQMTIALKRISIFVEKNWFGLILITNLIF